MYFTECHIKKSDSGPSTFKNDPGRRGFIFPKYELILSHGDPFRAQNYECWMFCKHRNTLIRPSKS